MALWGKSGQPGPRASAARSHGIRLVLCGGSDFLNGLNDGLDLLLSIERPNAKSDRATNRGGAKLRMHQGSAMEPSPAGDIMVNIKHGSDIRSIHAPYVEGQDSDVLRQIPLAIQDYPGDAGEPVAEHTRQLHLVLMNGVKPSGEDPFQSRIQAGNPDGVWRSIFQAKGILVKMEPVG